MVMSKDVPVGYKLTEVGMIPEDWEVKRIKEIAPLQRGFDLPVSTQKAGKYPVVYSNGITSFHNSFTTKAPGVVTGRSGTLGKVHYVENDYWAHNTTLWVTNFFSNYPLYIYYLYSSLKLERFGSGSGVPTLNRNDVHDYFVAIPQSTEQEAIALVLSDTDALITSLDKLIAKKRDIKQAAMQQLLTGKQRLEGFGDSSGKFKQTEIGLIPEDWQSITLGEIFTLKNGYSFSSEFFSDRGEVVLTPGNFRLNGGLYFDERNTKRYSGIYPKSMIFSNNDLLIVMTDLTPECNLLGKPAFVNSNEVILHNQRIGKVVLKVRDSDTKYLYYVLLSSRYLNQIRNLATGSTVRHTSPKSIYSVSIAFPYATNEQQAIAKVLSDMDSEISALEQRRDKTKALKQAMMQELLTGRIRLREKL
jgi:type I restriction enzyme S subunit